MGSAVVSAMIWRHRRERVPPPIARSPVSFTPVPASIESRLYRISNPMDSRMERYMWAREWVPRQPTTAPRATESQWGDWTAFQ